MTKDELDFARVKDFVAALIEAGAPEVSFDDAKPEDQQKIIDIMRAIRLGDEARGLRVVPVEATPEMRIVGWRNFTCVPQQEDRMQSAYRAMLAASPFASEGGT